MLSDASFMEFWARVGGSGAYVRILPTQIEWSLIGRRWTVEVVPIETVRSVTVTSGLSRSTLAVNTDGGRLEFYVDPVTAQHAHARLRRLIASRDRRHDDD